jgi:hypothetical protein
VAAPEGVAHHVARHDDRDAVLTFGGNALTLVIADPSRFFRRGAKRTLTVPYADILSASYDEGPINRFC